MTKEDYLEAGRIARELREKARALVEPGVKLLDVAQFADSFIQKEGAKAAFPINISINDVAAHDTPSKGDERVFEEGDVVKIDVGVAVNDCPADTAGTVTLSDDKSLQEAAEKALEAALEAAGPETTLHQLGAAIEEAISSRGFRPITNLTGHSMEEGSLHSGISIPNFPSHDERELGEGVFAIEPFATAGEGRVKSSEPSQIFRLVSPKPLRMKRMRRLQEKIGKRFGTFPFASRWVDDQMGLKFLVQKGVLHNYPVLREVAGAPVSQAEKTILIEGGEVTVTT